MLADGREVRLAPVAVPGRSWRGRESIPVIRRLAAGAHARLAALALNRDLMLAHKAPPDRYGRVRAQAFLPNKDGSRLWLQGELVRSGLGRVESDADTRLCAGELLRLEALARQERLGLWRLRMFQVRDEGKVGRSGSWQIVEGRIRSITQTRGRVWLNFGENWRTDFTVGVAARAARRFGKGYFGDRTGARVRVRGVVEDYNGPFVEVTHPEQFEWLEEGGEARGEKRKARSEGRESRSER